MSAADTFIESLMDTSLYSMGAYFSDEHPDLVDEVMLFSAPHPIGPQGLPALADRPLTDITDSSAFRLRNRESLGDDSLSVYERVR